MIDQEVAVQVGTAIKYLREQKGLTAYRVAKDSGLQVTQLTRIEKGEYPQVTFFSIYKIFLALGIDLLGK